MAIDRNRRRHYRAAQKQIEKEQVTGVLISKESQTRFMIIAALGLVLVFLKGLVMGILIGQKHQ